MKTKMLVVVAWLGMALTGCVRTAVNEATGEVDLDVEPPTQQGEDWSGTLTGQGNWANITGESRALVAEGRTQLSITVRNAPSGQRFAWVVREGKCGEQGAVVGTANYYSLLVIDGEGRAGATTTLDVRLDEAKDYVVELYGESIDSVTGRRPVVACGDLDD